MSESHESAPFNKCKRCGRRSVLVTTIPKRSENGAYQVYQCVDCQSIEWLQQDPHE
jgi:hydrogenase maturation factor HypF (carbamoyltransferase family)